MSSDLLTEVLRWRLAKPDCDRGVIVDGLDSRLASGATAAVAAGVGAQGGQDTQGGQVGSGKFTGGKTGTVAKALVAAMPSARLLVLQFEGDERG